MIYLDLCDDEYNGESLYQVGYYLNGEGQSLDLGCTLLNQATQQANEAAEKLGFKFKGEWQYDGANYIRYFNIKELV